MKKIIIITVIFLGGFLVSHAQEKEKVVILPYKEAIKIALENNLNLNQQKNNLFSRQVQRNQSVAAFLPNLSIQGQASRTEGQQTNPNGGELLNLTQDYVQAGIQTNLMLFNGLNRINTLNQTNSQFKAQSSLVKRTEQEVVFNVTTQYLQVLLDQQLLTIAEEAYRTQDVILSQLRDRKSVV